MPHFYKRLTCMVLMSLIALSAARYLPAAAATSGRGDVHYETPVLSENEAVVLTADGENIGVHEFAGYVVYCQLLTNQTLSMWGMDESIWDDNFFFSRMLERAQERVLENRETVKLFDKYGLKLTRAQRKEATAQKTALIEQAGGQEQFEALLSANGYTEQMYDNQIFCSLASDQLSEYLFGKNGISRNDAKRIKDLEAGGYLRAKHILIKSTDANKNELTGDALAAAQKKLSEVQEKLASGENFDAVMNAYNEDEGMASNPEGYLFTTGEMVQEFEDGTLALQPGEISAEPVKTEFGWHIIERLPIDAAYVDANRSGIDDKLGAETIDDIIENRISKINVEHASVYNEITNANKWKYTYFPDYQS